MPAKRSYTAAELRQRLERQRALTRARVARWRERRRVTATVTVTETVTVTPYQGPVPLPPTPSPLPSLSTKGTPPAADFGAVRRELERFAGRGYVHSDRVWQLLHEQYPALNLELEAQKLAEWLLEPGHLKDKCTKRRLDNWLARADVDRQQREAQARLLPPSVNGPAAPRPAPGKPPDPAPVLPPDVVLERIDPRVAERALLDAKRLTLPEKIALAKNGAHR